jgi:hypothetical protein
MTPVTTTATKTTPIGVARSAPDVKMGASLFEHADATSVGEDDDVVPYRFRGTITLSWWGLGLAAAGLMVIGAALSVAMMPRRSVASVAPAPVPAPIAAVVSAPVPAPAVIEPLAAAPAPAPVPATVEPPVAAVPSRPVKAVAAVAPLVPAPAHAVAASVTPREPVKRPRVAAPPKRAKPAAAGDVDTSQAAPAPAEKPWVDPFAE